jgi:cell wall-associated NlpC family hydrolase
LAAAQAAAAAAQAAASSSSGSANATLAGLNDAAPPPTAAGGEGAVQAAESQVGVPYVWGAESPKGSADPGFDCSGLTAWSWGQVGVGLPHFSGAQMSDSTPVPLSDLQPGDLLFYGPGGDEHVAMYVSPGTMVEAPETGEDVHVTGIRLGGDFVGAGRP